MKKFLLLLSVSFFLFGITSCSQDEEQDDLTPVVSSEVVVLKSSTFASNIWTFEYEALDLEFTGNYYISGGVGTFDLSNGQAIVVYKENGKYLTKVGVASSRWQLGTQGLTVTDTQVTWTVGNETIVVVLYNSTFGDI